MDQATQQTTKQRALEVLSQTNQEGRAWPIPVDRLANQVGTDTDNLRSLLKEMVKEGYVQKIGQDSYRYTPTKFPQEGESFQGKVVGQSFHGGIIVNDDQGGSWRIEPA
jgi:predicted transcriptional regulator